MICIFQGACNSDGSRVVDWGGLIIMFLGVALTGVRVLFGGSSLKFEESVKPGRGGEPSGPGGRQINLSK